MAGEQETTGMLQLLRHPVVGGSLVDSVPPPSKSLAVVTIDSRHQTETYQVMPEIFSQVISILNVGLSTQRVALSNRKCPVDL